MTRHLTPAAQAKGEIFSDSKGKSWLAAEKQKSGGGSCSKHQNKLRPGKAIEQEVFAATLQDSKGCQD